jgi:hypothetical protein
MHPQSAVPTIVASTVTAYTIAAAAAVAVAVASVAAVAAALAAVTALAAVATTLATLAALATALTASALRRRRPLQLQWISFHPLLRAQFLRCTIERKQCTTLLLLDYKPVHGSATARQYCLDGARWSPIHF